MSQLMMDCGDRLLDEAHAGLAMALCAESSARQRPSPSFAARSVEPTMSENMNRGEHAEPRSQEVLSRAVAEQQLGLPAVVPGLAQRTADSCLAGLALDQRRRCARVAFAPLAPANSRSRNSARSTSEKSNSAGSVLSYVGGYAIWLLLEVGRNSKPRCASVNASVNPPQSR